MFCSRLGSFSRAGSLSGSNGCLCWELFASGEGSGFGSFGFPHQDMSMSAGKAKKRKVLWHKGKARRISTT